MDEVKLLKRADTKFIFNAENLQSVLEVLRPNYRLLSTQGNRVNKYRTVYFDTADLDSYIKHHNGNLNRVKIRFREYLDSDLTFLEVKFKNNKGKTIKSRIEKPAIEEKLSDSSKEFIDENSIYDSNQLSPVLWNSFTRLTFVHKIDKERLTFDLNISFRKESESQDHQIPHLIIAEVKQEKMSLNSDFIRLMKRNHILQTSLSKYCIGTVLTNKDIKSNRFKKHILKINKLKNDRTIIA
ncbi:polyphosphate polymerase domain-containing protein [Brumimicrobium aurantiacum]|uniref:VTC domain-containing protein n=1 Tax=Brumimicrobium aurantiacum TaxID=1737063 RepID=A0A3E1EV02_9FLAO|nr:polyphosphate polymerase domain-containing protein [Brumimicrobium aurantiacum]RFC53394.1 VTC domain-containing protein [Brumimicrobium aurantiacum]